MITYVSQGTVRMIHELPFRTPPSKSKSDDAKMTKRKMIQHRIDNCSEITKRTGEYNYGEIIGPFDEDNKQSRVKLEQAIQQWSDVLKSYPEIKGQLEVFKQKKSEKYFYHPSFVWLRIPNCMQVPTRMWKFSKLDHPPVPRFPTPSLSSKKAKFIRDTDSDDELENSNVETIHISGQVLVDGSDGSVSFTVCASLMNGVHQVGALAKFLCATIIRLKSVHHIGPSNPSAYRLSFPNSCEGKASTSNKWDENGDWTAEDWKSVRVIVPDCSEHRRQIPTSGTWHDIGYGRGPKNIFDAITRGIVKHKPEVVRTITAFTASLMIPEKSKTHVTNFIKKIQGAEVPLPKKKKSRKKKEEVKVSDEETETDNDDDDDNDDKTSRHRSHSRSRNHRRDQEEDEEKDEEKDENGKKDKYSSRRHKNNHEEEEEEEEDEEEDKQEKKHRHRHHHRHKRE